MWAQSHHNIVTVVANACKDLPHGPVFIDAVFLIELKVHVRLCSTICHNLGQWVFWVLDSNGGRQLVVSIADHLVAMSPYNQLVS